MPVRCLALLIALLAAGANAAEFRAAAENAVILYDAPSTKARKLFIANRGYPLEVVVQVEGWVKVRDATGALSWAEVKSLDNSRNVLVRAASVALRQKPADDAPVVAELRRDVLLELVDRPAGGWAQVRHRDAGAGFVRVADIWGE
ncbi:MAG: SH3 domain-containing protein [Betaproteobacteria bacterium]|jgi:SH3-like domain-containing protein